MQCTVDISSCGIAPSGCNGLADFMNCFDEKVIYKCGRAAALYQCNYSSIMIKYTTSCTDQLPNCDILSSSGDPNPTKNPFSNHNTNAATYYSHIGFLAVPFLMMLR